MKFPLFSQKLSIFLTCAVAGFSFFPKSAKAVDSIYLGLAASSCAAFNKISVLQTPDAKEQLKPYLIWVSGAGTGYENACRSLYNNQCSGKNLDLGRLMVGVREQCNMHPTDLFGDAVTEAWRIIYFTQKSLEAQKAAEDKMKKPHYKKTQTVKRSSEARKILRPAKKPATKAPAISAPQNPPKSVKTSVKTPAKTPVRTPAKTIVKKPAAKPPAKSPA